LFEILPKDAFGSVNQYGKSNGGEKLRELEKTYGHSIEEFIWKSFSEENNLWFNLRQPTLSFISSRLSRITDMQRE